MNKQLLSCAVLIIPLSIFLGMYYDAIIQGSYRKSLIYLIYKYTHSYLCLYVLNTNIHNNTIGAIPGHEEKYFTFDIGLVH